MSGEDNGHFHKRVKIYLCGFGIYTKESLFLTTNNVICLSFLCKWRAETGSFIKVINFGHLLRTAGISGLSGTVGTMFEVFRDIFSGYQIETVQKTVTRVKTVNKCQYGYVDVTVPEFIYVRKPGVEGAAKSAVVGLIIQSEQKKKDYLMK